MMSQGDKDTVDESKMPDPIMVDARVGGRNNPHGDASYGNITQAVSEIQHGDDDFQDWDTIVLNHVLVNILDKDQVDANATNDFTVFVIANNLDDVRLILALLEDDYQSMAYDIDFKTFRTLQTLNKMCDEQVLDAMSKEDKNTWFLNVNERNVMCYMMRNAKVTTIPLASIITTPNVPLGRLNSNKAKLETARRSSLAMCDVGKPVLAPTPTANTGTRQVTFGPNTTASNAGMTSTPAAPTAASTAPAANTAMVLVTTMVTAPTSTHVTSRALEFDKGGRQSSSDYGKLQNREQWSKWHCALMGNAYKHKCEQVLDPSYAPNPNDPDKIALFGLQQQFMYSVFAKMLVEGKAADVLREYSDPRD